MDSGKAPFRDTAMSARKPLVSVIMPCYNGADWVATAVRSVLEQDVADLELILADDCSTDASRDVAREAAAGDSRLVLLSAPRNLGMTANWNSALSQTRGRYVCKLDCDDAWHRGTMQALLDAYDTNPGLTAVFCRTTQCDADLNPISAYRGDLAFEKRGVDPAIDSIRPTGQWYQWCFDDIQLWHSNAFMLRREILVDGLGGWDQRYGCASDTDLILRVLEQDGDVAHLSHVGVMYRATPGSVSDAGRREGWVEVEGMLASALSLQRTAARRKLSRHLATQRMRYRSALQTILDGGYRPPARVAAGHAALVSELRPQTLAERLVWRARCAASNMLRWYAGLNRS